MTSETLCWWERGMRSSVDNIEENPQVVIFYQNSAERIRWRFHGRVTMHASGAERERAMGLTPPGEMDRDPERRGVAVLMKVETISELSGNVLQEADLGTDRDSSGWGGFALKPSPSWERGLCLALSDEQEGRDLLFALSSFASKDELNFKMST